MDAQGRNWRGFTLVEVLATLAIVGVLVSLALPAVMRARSAARRIDCGSRLAQVGVAMASYADSCGRFACTRDESLWVNLAPWLGAAPDGMGLRRDGGYDAAVHAALARRLQCPAMRYSRIVSPPTADGLVEQDRDHVAVSYVGNAGPYVPHYWLSDDLDAGGTVTGRGVRPAEIVDGLSRTALVSELLVATLEKDASGTVCRNVAGATSAMGLVDLCAAGQFDRDGSGSGIGHHYTSTTVFGDALYCHGLPPGAVSCIAGDDYSFRSSAIAAASAHDEVVNVLHCDGSLQSYSYSVALPIWRALGTRAGGEAF